MTRHAAIFAKLLLSFPLIAGIAGTGTEASAQTEMKATIPFTFSVGNHRLPAGSYSVERLSGCFLVVRSNIRSRSVALMVRREEGPSISSASRLVFRQDAAGMYLTQVWFAGSSEHVEAVQKPSRSLEYAKESWPTSATMEVALK